MSMISIDTPRMSLSENTLPSIQLHGSVTYIQNPTSSALSFQDSGVVRKHGRSLSVTSSVQFPKLPSKVLSNLSPSERVVDEAYTYLYSLNSQVTEKGDIYKDLAFYLKNVSRHKPIYMTRTDWSADQISHIQALNSFKSYFDYLEGSTTKSSTRKESVHDNEIEPYARFYEKGDTEKVGWDKSDVYDMLGKKSSTIAYYLIEKHAINRKNRLQFSEFLKYCLPDHKKFDESSVNRFYSKFHKRRSSLVICS
jgi:hypothetical protein